MQVPGVIKRVFDTFPLYSLPNEHSPDPVPSLFISARNNEGLCYDPKCLEAQLWCRSLNKNQKPQEFHASCEAAADKRLPVASGLVLDQLRCNDNDVSPVYATMVHTRLWPLWICTVLASPEWFSKIYIYENEKLPAMLVERMATKLAHLYFGDLVAEYPTLRDRHLSLFGSKFNYKLNEYIDDTTIEEIYAKAQECLNTLSSILENDCSDELFGGCNEDKKPSNLDLIVFSYTYPLLQLMPDKTLIPDNLQRHSNRVHQYLANP